MHTILFYDFADDYLTRRAPYRGEHLALVRAAFERGELALAGALADPADSALLVFRGTSPETAEAFAKTDPYVIHGLVTAWRTRRWNTVVGDGASMP
jgi:hypothetical protein